MTPSIKEYIRNYQREWIKKRRISWLEINGPCSYCSSWENIELDHIDRKTKVSSRIWSWKESRRLEELAKCQVLCSECHKNKTIKEISTAICGSASKYSSGCRCESCKGAVNKKINEWRWKTGRRKKRD